MQYLPSFGTSVASLSDGRHACSRRCQLALDPTVRGTDHRPLHSSGDCNVVWFWFVNVFDFVALFGDICPVILRYFDPFVANRRATARTTETLSHAATSKKKCMWAFNSCATFHWSKRCLLGICQLALDLSSEEHSLRGYIVVWFVVLQRLRKKIFKFSTKALECKISNSHTTSSKIENNFSSRKVTELKSKSRGTTSASTSW